MSDSALIPIEQKAVIFYDDEITAVLVKVDDMKLSMSQCVPSVIIWG
ncbi:MAG: hypothetical protein M5U34_33485 [Chloroflexi bacterium]|nr:hypothetical protein [Chloroflexota bacterium]